MTMPGLPEWIVVDAQNGIVDAYQLLELPPGEPDLNVIRTAIERARDRLEDSASGHNANDRLALKEILDRAEEILTDPKRKEVYDELISSHAAPSTLRSRFSLSKWLSLPADQRWKLAVTVAALCVTAIVGSRVTFQGPEQFPKRISGPPPVKGADMDSPRLPPPPPKLSVPGLVAGISRKLRGLEEVTDIVDFTLSADLRILVFSRDVGPPGGSNLFLTTRKGAADTFAKPQPMGAVNTKESERSPSLSRDGLELIFLRGGQPFVTSRPSRSERFRTPEPLPIPGVDPERESVDSPQIFADGLSVSFRVRAKQNNAANTPPRYVIAERAATSSFFERTDPVEVWRPRVVNVFSADQLRNYIGLDGGLSLSTRRGLNAKFGAPGLIQKLTPSKVGPIDGAFWITPQEDVLFFCSPGPEPEKQANPAAPRRYLWQVLIR